MSEVHVVGGGLAGSEAAWQLAEAGIDVILHEMRGSGTTTPAHQTDRLAELVCSNSFRSDEPANAVGLLHQEMRLLGSLVLREGDLARLPAGSALAVDRDAFADGVTAAIAGHPRIRVERGRVDAPDPSWGQVILATGPLTAEPLMQWIAARTGADNLAFFDAIAPIVHAATIDRDIVWAQSRWNKGTADYLNCPLSRDEYHAFVAALLAGETAEFREWERDTPYFEGCMPVEVMAARGVETLRHGPMKPFGLMDPRTGKRPYAVVQLRQDNSLGTLYNIVGFQTKLRHAEQLRVFRTIPGLHGAEFARLGGLHRNSFINAPRLLDGALRLKAEPRLRFAGQMTGCEGYVESAAVGLLAGRFAAAEIAGRAIVQPPATTAVGALLSHITGGANAETYQPMNVNFGLFPPVAEGIHKSQRKAAYVSRAERDFAEWTGGPPPLSFAEAAE